MRILISKDPRYPLDNKKIREKVEEILKQLGIKNVFEISLAFVGKRKALEMNHSYRRADYIPEVLTFSQEGEKAGGQRLLGDILICFPQARERALAENKMVDEVIEELLIHGLKNLISDLPWEQK
jgi:rRNA maturation RNase YbeY